MKSNSGNLEQNNYNKSNANKANLVNYQQDLSYGSLHYNEIRK